jgi:DNA-binding winged helix-turn-helix (wHTH) protein
MHPPEQSQTIRFGPFELDTAACVLRVAGVARTLAPQPFRVLVLLTERAGELVTRQEIRQCLWGERKYVDVDSGINFCVNQIRSALRDPAEVSQFIKTLPRRGYCFVAPVTHGPTVSGAVRAPPLPDVTELCKPPPTVVVDRALAPRPAIAGTRRYAHGRTLLRAITAMALIAGISAPMSSRHAAPQFEARFSSQDVVVVADFTNTTGETLFDDTLTHVLSMELGQSPFVNVMSVSKVRARMQMMGLAGTERITPEIARELCVRAGAKAAMDGTVSSLGSHYAVTLNAIECESGAALNEEHGEADRREDVLRVLSAAASRLRRGLGESLPSVQKFDVPADATTSSLEALKSFTTGLRVLTARGDAPSIPFFKRALELDPRFALADAALAARYSNLAEPSFALQYARAAFELRDRVTEPERLLIGARYLRLTGEVEKLTQLLEMWKSEYPRDERPYGSLGANYIYIGAYAKAVNEFEQEIGITATDVSAYENLADAYLALNRPDDAQVTLNAASAHHLDSAALRRVRYRLAFLRRDSLQMDSQVDWAIGKPGAEDVLLSAQADTEAYFGRLANARRVSRRAVDAAVRSDLRETGALWLAQAALREAEYGERLQASSDIHRALSLSDGRNLKVLAALTFARVGDSRKAKSMAADLEQNFANNTVLIAYRMPSVNAAIALGQRNPRKALEYLEIAEASELGQPTPTGLAPLYPVYLRGQAYLALKDGPAAAAEFQKILDHPGIALASPLAPLAQLGCAQAAVMSNDTDAARSAYRALLLLWKDADAGLAPLNAARAELTALPTPPPVGKVALMNAKSAYAPVGARAAVR